MDSVDIGGPTMIRSAAKNAGWVTVIVDPYDYQNIIDELSEFVEISFETRKKLSVKAFGHTAQYDTIIHNYLKNEKLSEDFSITFEKHSDLRYGENPHQNAAIYSTYKDLNLKHLHGKKLSFNNYNDIFFALSISKFLFIFGRSIEFYLILHSKN